MDRVTVRETYTLDADDEDELGLRDHVEVAFLLS